MSTHAMQSLSARRVAAALVLVLLILLLALLGCAGRIGSAWQQTAAKTGIDNPSPTTVGVTFDAAGAETAAATGIGPGRYTVITGAEIRTLQSGSTPRDLWYRVRPDGTLEFSLSSGSDIEAEGVEFDPATRLLRVARFSTSASAPLRALEGLMALAMEYAAARDEQERAAIEARMRAIEGVAPSLIDALLTLATGGVR